MINMSTQSIHPDNMSIKPENADTKELGRPALQGEVLYPEYIERIRTIAKIFYGVEI